MLSSVEKDRLFLSKHTEAKKKSRFGQYLTPKRVADFMASLFVNKGGHCRLLDAGAGIGSLSVSFLDHWVSGKLQFDKVDVDAFEIDTALHPYLSRAFEKYQMQSGFHSMISGEDYILASARSLAGDLFGTPGPGYSHAVLNPPYKKLTSTSLHRHVLRRVGIETVNLYSAFVALAVAQMASGGQVVAIIPRSFCNGPYYRPFRDFILSRVAIRHLHLFTSRNTVFQDDKVLQENIILLLERDAPQGSVIISTSTDDRFADMTIHEHEFDRIVSTGDLERIISIPTSPEPCAIELSSNVHHTLSDLGIKVSTGPVIDFRLKEHVHDLPGPGTVPLLYPGHFVGQKTIWPNTVMKKPNAIKRNQVTEKWLYPNGYYCVVRRFSSKEERRRIVASVVDPRAFDSAQMLGFENHLNVFHDNKRGLSEPMARGLAMFLNTTAIDLYFRMFNGHTQVNAADLRRMKYPSRETIIQLGMWAMRMKDEVTQSEIDEKLGDVIE